MRVHLIRAIIYDHDGTLVNTLPVVVEATNRVLAARGHAQRPAKEIVAGMVMPTGPRLGALMQQGDQARQRDLAAEFYRHAREIGPRIAKLYDGIADMIAAVAESGRPQGLVSNNEGRFIRLVLSALKIDRHLACIIGEEDMPAPKPDPRGLIAAAESLGMSVADCVYVGDSGPDVLAARAAGMHAIGVTWGTHSRSELSRLDFDRLIDDPGELISIVG